MALNIHDDCPNAGSSRGLCLKVAFVVNRIETEQPRYTTNLLARTALRRGHEVWFTSVADFTYDSDNRIRARACAAPEGKCDSGEQYLAALRSDGANRARIVVDDLDVLWLRNDPGIDALSRSWAQYIGFLFGQAAKARGVVVVSDPDGLARAMSDKMYSQHFPESVRPKTLIARDPEEIMRFVASHPGDLILKPLHGGAGHGVFLARKGNEPNLQQIVEILGHIGYLVVQEYLPAAVAGVVRLFMLDGKPLQGEGRIAVLNHIPGADEIRSNFRVSGSIAAVEPDDELLRVADAVGPRLAADGMFLVGLDVVGGKVLEANVFSPGGLAGAERLQGVSFSDIVISALEEKVGRAR
jgi:glutathione synthase